MEPTIYKPSIYKGAGIYNTGSEGGGGGDLDLTKFIVSDIEQEAAESLGNLNWKFPNTSTGWFWTPKINLQAATKIDEYWKFIVDSFETIENGSIGMGEWYNNDPTYKVEFSIYIYADKIIVTYGKITTQTFNVAYNLGDLVEVEKHINLTYANIIVKYNGVEVVNFTTSTSNLILRNCKFHIGGLRNLISGYGFKGSIDFMKSKIIVDNTLVWGVG